MPVPPRPLREEAPVPRPHTALGRFFDAKINDPRDYAFVLLIGQCGALIALGLLLYIPGVWRWWLAAIYLAVWGLGLMDRYILMLHFSAHRTLFRREWGWANRVIPWVIGPFFGQTPETYFSHHMGMHHPENNMPDDLSTTMPYQRDRLGQWLLYFGDFFFRGPFRVPRYHFDRGRTKLGRRFILGEITWWATATALLFVNWQATLTLFFVPLVMVRVLMMAGNWGQHAFVDRDDPNNPYRNSITCIRSRYNRRTFNDGYHIHHHVKPRAHWSELPAEFAENIEEYGRQDAIVFEGLDFFLVWACLMTGYWKPLVAAFVQLPGAPVRDEAQIRELFAHRLARIEPEPAATPSAAVA